MELSAQGADAPRIRTAADPRVVGTAFMFVAMPVMAATMALALFVQTTGAYLACALIYIVQIVVELRYRVFSPISWAIMVACLAVAGFNAAGVETVGYVGIGIFAWLFTVVSVLHAVGRPFSSFYSKGEGVQVIHQFTSWTWIITYGAALLASWALIPSVWFVVLPIVFCFAAALFMLFVNLVYFGSSNARRRHWVTEDGFRFDEIDERDPRFVQYCDFYADAIFRHPQQTQGTKTLSELRDVVHQGERKLGRRARICVCTFDGRIVGTIHCVLDQRDAFLPVELEINSSLDPLRSSGRIIEVGRLAVDEQLRHQPAILNGLFSYFVNLALEKDVSYVVSSGFPYVIPTYARLGFESLFRRSDRRYVSVDDLGYSAHTVVLDFEQIIHDKGYEDGLGFEMYEMAQDYLAERWFKRSVARNFFKKISHGIMIRGSENIRAAMRVDNEINSSALIKN